MTKTFSSSLFEPFRERLFRTLWIAAFVSNIGTWMQNVGVSWLAATFSASPLMIALIQTASSLPALVVSYPGGVISDHCDRRKLLIGLQIFLFAVTAVLSVLAYRHMLDIRLLILFTLLTGIGSAFNTPVWQAITPETVSRQWFKEAIALNGINFNLARAVGPALGGIMLAIWGVKSIFLFNALSFLALIWGLMGWKNVYTHTGAPFLSSAREGLAAIRRSEPYKKLLVRTISFTGFVSIVFAFLPRLSKYEWKQTSGQYTWLWVALGLGALAGGHLFGLLTKNTKLTRIVWLGCVEIGGCLFLLTLSRNAYYLDAVMFLTGIGWINTTSSLNVMAQQYAPDALKGRFLAANVTVFQGSIALSSAFWGYLSDYFKPLTVVEIAAVGMIIFSTILSFFPIPEPATPTTDAVPCSDPLLQYHALNAASSATLVPTAVRPVDI